MHIHWREAAGYALLILAACFWGGSASLGKTMFQAGISTVMLMEIRSVISVLILVPMLALTVPNHLRINLKKDLLPLTILGIPGIALVNASYYHAVRLMPVAIAVFIQFSAPLLVFLYGLLTRKEHSSVGKLLALGLSITGTFLMVQIQQNSLQKLPMEGILSAVLSMFTYAFYVIYSHGLSRKHSSWTLVAYGYGIAALFWCIVQNPVETFAALTAKGLWLHGVMFALFSTLIPFLLFMQGLKYVSPTGAAIASTSETVTASLFAFFFLNERLAEGQIFGAVLILAAVILLILSSRQARVESDVVH
jgi:drug/metabolite transporter (DMT)-like permease